MKANQTALERAFELAKSGRCSSAEEVRKVLAKEGYPLSQLTGRALREQIKELIRKAKVPKN
jgi:hypothetical protein